MNKFRDRVLPISIKAERERKKERLKKRYDDPQFRKDITRTKQSVSMGMTLNEARINCGFADDLYWEDLKFALSISIVNPEGVILEWQIRNQNRYQQALRLFSEASAKERDGLDKDGNPIKIPIQPDKEMMLKALMILQKIDESDIEMKRAFGLVEPIQEETPLVGFGTTSEGDLEQAERRFNSIVEQRIIHKLEAQRKAVEPVTIDVLSGSEPSGQPDSLGQTAVAVHPTAGFESANSLPQRVPDGGFDVLHSMDVVVVQDETNT